MTTATLPRPEAKRRWTYDEFAAESSESNLPTELWDGEIITSAAPRPQHQVIVLNLAEALNRLVKPRQLGRIFITPIDVVFSGSKAVQPDVVYISNARKSMVGETCIRGVPELLIEVISEGTWRRDRVDKKALYRIGEQGATGFRQRAIGSKKSRALRHADERADVVRVRHALHSVEEAAAVVCHVGKK